MENYKHTAARFFLTKEQITDRIILTGSDAHHAINVLRLKPNDFITVCDMQKTEYVCKIDSLNQTELFASVISAASSPSENQYITILYQALIKGDKFDAVVQKATELGINTIVPVLTERCVSRPDAKALAGKLDRYRKIAKNAAEQCGRGIIPEIRECMDFESALSQMKQTSLPFLCYEGDDTLHIKQYFQTVFNENPSLKDGSPSISFLIGPEGGLSFDEVYKAKDAGIPLIGLGNRILRTETASLFVLSALNIIFS